MLTRVHTFVMDQEVRGQELLQILHSLKPKAIDIRTNILEDEDSAMIKEGL